MRLPLIAILGLLIACDQHGESDEVAPRYWGPEQIQVHADVTTPLIVAPIFDCFDSDEQPAEIEYSDGLIGDDDKKTISVCVTTRGHEDRAKCWREALEKLGGEVVP